MDWVGVDEVHARHPLELCNGSRCDAMIRRVFTEAGNRMPIDPDPVPDMNVVIRRDGPDVVRAVVLAGHDNRDPDEPTWRSHFVTCPNAAEYRRRRQLVTPKCHGCTDPLDRPLVADPRTTWERLWHACCAPAIAPRPTKAAAPDLQEALLP